LLQGYKPVQHVTVLNTVGNGNAMVLYYNITRIKLYNTLALPVLLYGSETWTINP